MRPASGGGRTGSGSVGGGNCDPNRYSHSPTAFRGRSWSASGLLLFDGFQPLLECINTVLERRNRAGGFLDVLGRCPGLLDRRLERLYSPLESALAIADRRHTALRRRRTDLALETIHATRKPLHAHPTRVLPLRVADVIEQRPHRDAKRSEREQGNDDETRTQRAQPVEHVGPQRLLGLRSHHRALCRDRAGWRNRARRLLRWLPASQLTNAYPRRPYLTHGAGQTRVKCNYENTKPSTQPW
jgi:hypothetical protein